MMNCKINIFFVLVFLISSCGHDHSSHDHSGHDHSGHDHSAHEKESTKKTEEEDLSFLDHDHGHDHGNHDESLHLTKKQIETIDLKLGSFSDIKINDFVAATGSLSMPPNSYVSVNTKKEGFLSESGEYVEVNFIKKGTIIAKLENIQFIEKQKEYLEHKAELSYLFKELKRQQNLMNENAGVQAKLDDVQHQVAIKEIQIKSLEKYFTYLDIPFPNSANEIRESVSIIAPISGYISKVDFHNGMYITPEKEMMEIVNEDHLHLELNVFEKDISLLKKGQTLTYTIPALGVQEYKAKIFVIGKEFDPENKTINIHAHLVGKKPKFIKDMFLRAKIWLNNSTVKALPENTIFKDAENYIIYTTTGYNKNDEMEFSKKRIIKGNSNNGFTAVQLIDELNDNEKIVIQAAHFVDAQSKIGQLKHEH